MPAGNYDLEIEQGATFTLEMFYVDENGDPVDLSGQTARMQIRQYVSAPAVLLSLTTENGRISIDGPAGKIALLIDAEDSAAIDWRKGVYDLEIVANPESVIRFIEGSVTVSPEVTR